MRKGICFFVMTPDNFLTFLLSVSASLVSMLCSNTDETAAELCMMEARLCVNGRCTVPLNQAQLRSMFLLVYALLLFYLFISFVAAGCNMPPALIPNCCEMTEWEAVGGGLIFLLCEFFVNLTQHLADSVACCQATESSVHFLSLRSPRLYQ